MPRAMNRIAAALCAALVGCSGSSSEETPDQRVRNLTFGGTVLSDATFYGAGHVELRVVPLDVTGKPILENGLAVGASIANPPGISATVASSECVQMRERFPLVLGVAVDASTSMAANDPDDASGPAPGRRTAVTQIVNALSVGDVGMVTDFFGTATNPLRDLICAAAGTETGCSLTPTAASLTGDVTALRSSTSALGNPGIQGTRLYDACRQMREILAPFTDRKAMVILSDGLPDDGIARATCLEGARSANISIYTVGFGTSAAGAAALRDLAEATGGSYAPSSDPAQLGRVLTNMGYSDGYCRVVLQLTGTAGLEPGTPVHGEVRVGTAGARAAFEFLAPPRS